MEDFQTEVNFLLLWPHALFDGCCKKFLTTEGTEAGGRSSEGGGQREERGGQREEREKRSLMKRFTQRRGGTEGF
jgi:hypothetical protein